jgi:hypothetical protein
MATRGHVTGYGQVALTEPANASSEFVPVPRSAGTDHAASTDHARSHPERFFRSDAAGSPLDLNRYRFGPACAPIKGSEDKVETRDLRRSARTGIAIPQHRVVGASRSG